MENGGRQTLDIRRSARVIRCCSKRCRQILHTFRGRLGHNMRIRHDAESQNDVFVIKRRRLFSF